jgi:hypothetical protein
MYYNAKGGSSDSEFIGMAMSQDMRNWTRYTDNPVIANGGSTNKISGDPQIVKIGDVWVMFYFGAFWDSHPENDSAAFDTFACSYDLVHWTKWDGPNLIDTTGGHDSYDKTFAHKPWIIKHNGVVYHYYCAVGAMGRVIALATSVDLHQAGNPFLGNVNGDSTINIVDALLIAQYYVDLDPQDFIAENADVNCDGSITITDALLIARYYVGLIEDFSC